MRINPGKVHPLMARAGQILDLAHSHRDEWAEVEGRTGVPRLWGIAIFEREAASDYRRSPAQGDRWDRVSTHVPKGRGPYPCWADACIDAWRLDHLDAVGRPCWTWTRACYEAEAYNGFGPRAHGRRSGYLWSWTSIYDGGKYTRDGRWSPQAIDRQCGVAPLMQALLGLDGTLALADASPAPAAGRVPARRRAQDLHDGEPAFRKSPY